MYLEYTDYELMGGTMESTAFALAEFRARKLIDGITHGRITNDNPIREAVKMAMFALVEAMQSEAEYHGKEVQSEQNDGISVTYASQGSSECRYRGIALACLHGEMTNDGVSITYAGSDA